MLGKNRRNLVRQILFYIHTNIVFKKRGQKNAGNNFCSNTQIVRKKCWEKIVRKSAKKRFLYSHEHRDRKMGTKNARNNFPRNTRIVRAKNVGKKKIVFKKCEKTFFIFTRIS